MSFTNIVKAAGNIQGEFGLVKNIIDDVLSMFGVDVVGVFDNDTYAQLFETARPMKATITRTRKIMDHPIETGAIVSDFAITMPVEIELSLLLNSDDYPAVYQKIRQYFMTSTLVNIQTKADVFSDMLIQGMPHEESPEMFDAIPLAFKLREVQQVLVQYQALPPATVTNPADSSTVDRGVQQPQESALYQIGKFAKGLF
jgi:hypothetical protein